jgi:chromosome segregation ATPase
MSDIAERMRRWQVGELDGFDELIVGDLTDGADEIGRLHSELNMEVVARRKVESDLADWESALQKRNAEIERLRAQVEAMKGYIHKAHERDGAEIEWLRTLLREGLRPWPHAVSDADGSNLRSWRDDWERRVREMLGDE